MDPTLNVGDLVVSMYGQGRITAIRDSDVVVVPTEWSLANDCRPTFYLSRASVTKIPGFAIGTVVRTVFGLGTLRAVRGDGTHVVEAQWTLADGHPVVAFVTPTSVQPQEGLVCFAQGTRVRSMYGEGVVTDVRGNGLIAVEMDSWRLADSSSPTAYLHQQGLVAC